MQTPPWGENDMKNTLLLVTGFMHALPDMYYRVQVKHAKADENNFRFDAFNKKLSYEQVIREMKFLKMLNAKGFHVYCRPVSYEYVLLDDLDEQGVENLKQYNPSVILETSPGNYQAFLKLARKPETWEEAEAICKRLAAFFNTDPKAAKPNQVGRLPGFTNRKPEYKNRDGYYPWVNLHLAIDRVAINLPLEGGACTSVPEAVRSTTPNTKPAKQNKSHDRSREDFAIACQRIREGYSDDEIFHILINRPKARERGRGYVKFTIRNAQLAVEKER